MIRVWVSGVSVQGPGLMGWTAAAPVLSGAMPWQEAPFTPPPPALLPATERRRTSPAVRLALATASDAVQESGLPPEELETIFASGNGDGAVVCAILDALHAPDGVISPTQFHNSVHNSAAGYWGIAMGSTRGSVSLGGHDHVFATGLMQAAAQVASSGQALLFCAYDAPLPPPLSAHRWTEVPFGAGLVLTPSRIAASRAAIELDYVAGSAAEPSPVPEGLAQLLPMNPVARGALPLLSVLAARRATGFALPLPEDTRLDLRVEPC